MRLKDCEKWKAIHFSDRTLLPEDKNFYSEYDWNRLLNLKVIPMGRGHYEVSSGE